MNLSFLGREPTALILAGSAIKIGPGVGPDAPPSHTSHFESASRGEFVISRRGALSKKIHTIKVDIYSQPCGH